MPQSPPARPDGARSLCLELHAPRDTVQLGEPVTVIASLLNCSSSMQQVQDLLAPELGFLQVWIQPPDRSEILNRPVVYRDARGKPTQALAPGARLSAFVPVYFNPDGWTVTRPGPYRIRAQFGGLESTTLRSNVVTVIVQAPRNALDGKAAEILLTHEAGMFLSAGRDPRGEGTRQMKLLVGDYGTSRLAPYARLALAVAESRDRFDPDTKSFRTGGCEQATPELAQAVPKVGDPVVAASGTAAWVRCLRQLGRDAEANRALSLFFKAHPEAREVPAVAQLLGTPARKD